MKLTETPLLDDESMAVLAVAYRARPSSVAQLSALLDASLVERLPDTLDALKRAGFFRVRGDHLELESPYMAFIAISQARVERLKAETDRTVTLMESLPLLIRNWDLGEARPGEDHPLVATLVHGHEDRWPVWQRHLAEDAPEWPSWVLPDVGMLRHMFTAHGDDFAEVVRRARILVRPAELHDPANQQMVAAAAGLGVEVRVLDELPGWFYVAPGSLAAMPVEWGEERPASILLIRTPPVISALEVVFDALWLRAAPAIATTRGWEPVVELLAQGMTDEAVGRFLGLDVRTVRRRVAEAMDDLGATSRFGLGMAWGRRA
jgi:hypothetical protein